ncbi:hypothetical protein ACFVR1_03490 [Psychrobacillus sp. NPDC058041]|uniref:hypothetical protein n=1 Tax=Psychrobacillus sp. NPDC058041 TaxID=3346310 RepID=UPI0036DC6250
MKDKIIQQYQEDENIMIRLFTQWCINHGLDALTLYKNAYPYQVENEILIRILEETEKDFLQVDTETVLHILELFGNEDLAFEVSQVAINL